ncbi:hypothetical protein Patl1_30282 [Pistacia atlantica]|uniref:Uncharacterized protein n=1 Tax=Pistacia atlantica TaxID=434234 RepID=A0ACC1ABB8_9ROSI|nr:hypothetical protein Patl1_30282 [Pistacia atlantica]
MKMGHLLVLSQSSG